MERHPVPQNLMDVEFKLFGRFTIRQFAYLACGCLLGVIFYYSDFPGILKTIFICISIGGGLLFSSVMINGQPSTVWLTNFILSMIVPQERLWRKTAVVPEILKEDKSLKLKTDKDVVKILSLPVRLGNLSATPLADLEKVETPLDIEENKLLKKIDDHFDFLFNKIPEISVNKTTPEKVGAFQKTQETLDPNGSPIIIKKQTIAQNIRPVNEATTVVYNTPTYTATMKHIRPNVNRPISLSNGNNQVEKISQIVNNNYIKGIVQNRQQIPITGAKVSILDDGNKLIKEVMTDRAGVFSTEGSLESGSYYIDVASEGYKFNRGVVNLSGKKQYMFKIISQN